MGHFTCQSLSFLPRKMIVLYNTTHCLDRQQTDKQEVLYVMCWSVVVSFFPISASYWAFLLTFPTGLAAESSLLLPFRMKEQTHEGINPSSTRQDSLFF